MPTHPQFLSAHALSIVSLLLVACQPLDEYIIYNPDHCANQTGNAYCVSKHGAARSHCGVGFEGCYSPRPDDGCLELKPEKDECYSPCGGMQNYADNPDQTCEQFPPTSTSTTTVAESTTTSSTSSSTGDTVTITTEAETTDEDPEASSTTELAESSSESTGAAGCLADEECLSASAPACDPDTGTCVPCSASETPDATCETFDPSTPVCFEDACVACTDDNAGACAGETPACVENTCVQCTPEVLDACTAEEPACGPENTCVQCTAENDAACQGTTPLCDDTSNTCVPCTQHDQCEAACDLETGECFPEDSVLHVDGDDGCSDGNPGSQIQPLCTVQAAIDLVADRGTIIVHAQTEGTLNIYAGASVSGSVVVAILAAEGEPTPVVQGTSSAGLSTTGGAVVYLDGLAFRSGSQDGITVSDARVHAENVSVELNGGVGVVVSADSTFHASACRIIGNTEGGIVVGDDGGPIEETGSGSSSSSSGAGFGMRVLDSPNLRLVNCFVNGTGEAPAVTLNAGLAEVLYSSLAGRQTEFDASQALFCDEQASVQVRNSLLVAPPAVPVIECSNVDVSRSAGTSSLEGTSNENLGNLQGNWFEDFGNGNLCLSNPPQPLLTAASWRSGDPTTDINGTLRPTQDGTADVAGADIPGDCE